METLTYGLKKPEKPDKGSTFFPALQENIEQLDSHTHNGSNSPKLPSSSIDNLNQAISSTNWVAVGDGTGRYRQAVTFPGSATYDNTIMSFKDSATGNVLMLDVEKISDNSYYVYINDNTIDLTVLYL